MKRKIFFRVFFVTAFSLIFFFCAGIAIAYFNGKKMLEKRLVTETRLTANLLDKQSDFEKFEHYYNNNELRVTIIDATDGEVLFESDLLEDAIGNRLDREEVVSALNDKPKAVERYSKTLDCKMTYYAVRDTLDDGTEVVVRLALRSSEVSSYFFTSLPFFFLSLLLTTGVAVWLAGRLSKNLSKRITEVGDCLKSLNAGQYMPLKANETEPEIYTLYEEINELNKSTHEYIRRQEVVTRRLNVVLENVAQGILAVNVRREIVFVNGSALRLFGGKQKDTGQKISVLIQDEKLCEDIVSRLGEKEFFFEHKIGEKTLSVFGKTIERLTDDEGLSDILIFTDITAEKEIIRQKSEFFANASHELKTPITVMRGLTEILLEKEEQDNPERKKIERIHKESLRLSDLISDMLKLSKLERREEETVSVWVDLREIAQEVFAELSETGAGKNLTFEIEGEGKVCADPKKIFELLQNLCSNAVNYNKQNGQVFVRISETEKETVLEVIDSGIGIEKEHIPHLCERFYRVDKSRSKKTGGTGLGLAIVKHICALYRAELTIESEFGQGTAVKVKFSK